MDMKKVRMLQNMTCLDLVTKKQKVPQTLHKYRIKRIAKKKVAKASRKINRGKQYV